jgi:hypothetical protein
MCWEITRGILRVLGVLGVLRYVYRRWGSLIIHRVVTLVWWCILRLWWSVLGNINSSGGGYDPALKPPPPPHAHNQGKYD